MPESTTAFPYETRLDILHGPLEVIDVKALAKACTFKWFNQTLCQVNGSVVRVGVLEGEYHWHKHDEDDEFFYVVEGMLLIDWKTAWSNSSRNRDLWCRRALFIAPAPRNGP